MEELINALNELFNNPLYVGIIEYPDDPYLYFRDDNDLHKKVVGLCNELLITDNGGCNWTNINHLKNNGFKVFAGERDSFGWITGCIQRTGDRKLTVVYG